MFIGIIHKCFCHPNANTSQLYSPMQIKILLQQRCGFLLKIAKYYTNVHCRGSEFTLDKGNVKSSFTLQQSSSFVLQTFVLQMLHFNPVSHSHLFEHVTGQALSDWRGREGTRKGNPMRWLDEA